MPTHYETLRVAPSASDADVRDAYRRLAREHHPDRTAATTTSAAGAAEGTTMHDINEAYRVLSDPARRAVYDAALRNASSAASAATPHEAESTEMPTRHVMHPSHLGPARVPWRSMLVVAFVGVVGVIVLAQFTEPGEPAGPDGILRVGDCAVIEANGDAREVLCTGDTTIDLRVDAFVAFDDSCPGRTEPHRDRQGMGIACLLVPPRS